MHVFFLCRTCERYITGCSPNCPGPHKIERVDNCAVCAITRRHDHDPERSERSSRSEG